jgi:hypothetical protein
MGEMNRYIVQKPTESVEDGPRAFLNNLPHDVHRAEDVSPELQSKSRIAIWTYNRTSYR